MTENVKKIDNSSYRERFQFQLQVNDNIICQRYFKIPKFNYNSLASEELLDTCDSIVRMLQKDLESKSRIYIANLFDCKVKLTGFKSKMEAYKKAKEEGADDNIIQHILLRREEDETEVIFPEPEFDESEFVNYGDVTFKFSFIVDDIVQYERIWDGSQYPKYVRNSVDITNSKSQYPMLQLMNLDKPDLAVAIINMICAICSNPDNDNELVYTKVVKYGNKKYRYQVRKFIN